ncbi:Zinc finger, C3HC4 type (RING finger) family protein [Cryptosporidium meleagridis]|uniref:Zinc finger, C3HC4 type (RING finger) family protein n=1 Tax=Cryptosporidium meleagridis TaxID=93969 RepID=A0A2P4YX19_9CRYT|nr:Zinc finger, C3HC4 type (RING finger) family protein [Cryptosporidium meleagridis]
MISFLQSQLQDEDEININYNQNNNETQSEDINAEGEGFDLENITDLGADLNDLMNDNEENTFGVSLYEDLIDIDSIDVERNNSNLQKTIENEITLKSKIETSLLVYKVNCERSDTTIIYEEKNVNFGLSNDLIGTGTLILEKIEDSDVYALSWEGKLLECYSGNKQSIQDVSKYSFLLQYIIDINIKIIQDDEFFIFIKSDFQLKNETIFLQFSFNSEEKADFWYNNLTKYKRLNIKKTNIEENEHAKQTQVKRSREYSNYCLINDQKNKSLSSSNSQYPKISIPFYRDNKHSKKSSNIPNTLSYYQSENLFPLIKHEDKVNIENQIKNLIYTNINSKNCPGNNSSELSSSFDIESNKPIIKQKCSFIKFIVNSIQSNILEDKFSISTFTNSIQSSSSCDNTLSFQKTKENYVQNSQTQIFTCPICYENFDYNNIITLQPCGHQLCFYCEHRLVDSKCPWDRSKYTIKSQGKC